MVRILQMGLRFLLVSLSGLCIYWVSGGCHKDEPVQVPRADTLNRINLFLETSASMGGYLTGNTDFKNIVSELANKLTQLEPVRQPVRVFTTSGTPTLFPGNVDEFSSSLATLPVATASSSELHVIFQQVCDSARSNAVSVLITDGILSFSNEAIKKDPNISVTDASSVLKNQINRQFARFRKDSIGAVVYQYTSPFNGTYYDFQNQHHPLAGESRPFYIWFFGKQRLLRLVTEKLQGVNFTQPLKQLTFGDNEPLTDYSLFYTLNRRGEGDVGEHEITGIKLNGSTNPFEFSIGANLSQLPDYAQQTAYLTNTMRVLPANLGIELVKVQGKGDFTDLEKLGTREAKMLHESTHVFTFRVTQLFDQETQLTVELPARYDSWYLTMSTMDDRTAEGRLNKTFAMSQLMSGIVDAYQTATSRPFFQFTLLLKN